MATWPTTNPVGTTTDADSDSISGARGDINQTIDNIIEVVNMFNIPASPTDNYILKYNASSGVFDMEADASGGGVVTGYTNGVDNRIITSSGATTINAEASAIWDGSNGSFSGTAGGLTSPVMEVATDNSGWNKPQMMFTDSNDDVFSMVGQLNTGSKNYQYTIVMDPNNTHGRTGVTTYAGDYGFYFNKVYDPADTSTMVHNVYGAHNGYYVTAYGDWNDGGGNQYQLKSIVFTGDEVKFRSGDNIRIEGTETQVNINGGGGDGAGTAQMSVKSDHIDLNDLYLKSTTGAGPQAVTVKDRFDVEVDVDANLIAELTNAHATGLGVRVQGGVDTSTPHTGELFQVASASGSGNDVMLQVDGDSAGGFVTIEKPKLTGVTVSSGAPTITHKFQITINGTSYYIGLDPV